MTQTYVELHARSASSFLRGSCLPEDLVEHAAKLNLPALALCDRDGVYGAPRFNSAANDAGIQPIIGSELTLNDGSILPVLVLNRVGYNNLCRLVTRAKLRGTKETAPVKWDELEEFAEGLVALTGDEEGPVRLAIQSDEINDAASHIQRLVNIFGRNNVYMEIQRHLLRGEDLINDQIIHFSDYFNLPLLATNGVTACNRSQQDVLDLFTCIRNHTTLDKAGRLLSANEERYLKTPQTMQRLFAHRPDAVENTLRLAERVDFKLRDMGYEFPRYKVPEGESMDTYLRKMAYAGARERYSKLTKKITEKLDKELELIARYGFSGYFLIVWDIINFAASKGILCQGRGSAANSVVCYSLKITACDPINYNLLFERFLSEGRKSWPDIDIDFPSGERREIVIQEVYQRYGKLGAAMTANVITFKNRSAMREVGKALDLPIQVIERFSGLQSFGDYNENHVLEKQLIEAGLPKTHPRSASMISLYQRLLNLPHHLGQHSGGMIICDNQLDSIVPLENATMVGRVVAQWDKEDCNELGIIKVDLLGLGMLAAMEDCLRRCEERGRPVDLAKIDIYDKATFDAVCRADTVGTFQVESRAQMITAPRLKPRCPYDMALQVSLVRPGPIVGDLKNPYLERRNGRQPVTYYDERLIPILERTLGIPLFQEQIMEIARIMGGLGPTEIEELRKGVSFNRSKIRMHIVLEKLDNAMINHGVKLETREWVIKSVKSFALYSFPESHAISFGMIAYCSVWLKVHRLPEFLAGLWNAQPMGFYSSDTLAHDAKRHGINLKPVSVLNSDWQCSVEDDDSVRIGLCYVKGLSANDGEHILNARTKNQFTSLTDFQVRTGLQVGALKRLAALGALQGLTAHRREALWQVGVERNADDLFAYIEAKKTTPLKPMTFAERTHADYSGQGMTTGPHAMIHVRHLLNGHTTSIGLKKLKHGSKVIISGMVICRQQPGTAKGNVFGTFEDETGLANIFIKRDLFTANRLLVGQADYLTVYGRIQNVENVIHVMAEKIYPLEATLAEAPASHDWG